MKPTELEILVEVPLDDADDLRDLCDQLTSSPPSIARGLTGEQILNAVLTLSAMSLPVIETWIIARFQKEKSVTFKFGPIELKGYSAADAAFIIDTLQRSIDIPISADISPAPPTDS